MQVNIKNLVDDAQCYGSCPLLVMVLKIINHEDHSSTSLQITRSHDRSRLAWYTWLRGCGTRLCRCTWEGRLGLSLVVSMHEAAAQEIEVRAAKVE